MKWHDIQWGESYWDTPNSEFPESVGLYNIQIMQGDFCITTTGKWTSSQDGTCYWDTNGLNGKVIRWSELF
jgi:hypothetical protein